MTNDGAARIRCGCRKGIIDRNVGRVLINFLTLFSQIDHSHTFGKYQKYCQKSKNNVHQKIEMGNAVRVKPPAGGWGLLHFDNNIDNMFPKRNIFRNIVLIMILSQ